MKLIDCIANVANATDRDYKELIYDLVVYAHDMEIGSGVYIIYYTTYTKSKRVIISSNVKYCIYYAATYGNGAKIIKVNEDGVVESML